MNTFFRLRLTLYKCVVSAFIQRSWRIRNWTIDFRSEIVFVTNVNVLFFLAERQRCHQKRTNYLSYCYGRKT